MKSYQIKVNGRDYEVTVNGVDGNGKAEVTVNGRSLSVEIGNAATSREAAVQTTAPMTATPQAAPQGAAPQRASGKVTDVVTPLPGVIIDIKVNVGDRVSAGQAIAVLEAMKMENAIEAECAGTVQAIHVQKGDSVLEGAKIATIA